MTGRETMKYVIKMKGGRTITPRGVYERHYTGQIFFHLDDGFYKYDPTYEQSQVKTRYFYRLGKNNQWLVVDEIECLLIYETKEEPELNFLHTTDYNAGYIYNKVERSVGSLLQEGPTAAAVVADIPVPKIQIIAKHSPAEYEGQIIEAVKTMVSESFNAVYHNFDFYFSSVVESNGNIVFSYVIKRKEMRKEMTIAEIEKELGYKIKIVKGQDDE